MKFHAYNAARIERENSHTVDGFLIRPKSVWQFARDFLRNTQANLITELLLSGALLSRCRDLLWCEDAFKDYNLWADVFRGGDLP